MEEIIQEIINQLQFIFERLNWLSIVDLALVTFIFFAVLMLLRDTQAIVLLRGVLLLVVLGAILSNVEVLPAFSWLVQTTLPALVLAIPVIFAPEIRRGLERIGRAGLIRIEGGTPDEIQGTINAVVTAATRLSERRHGALIVIQRGQSLEEYIQTGVRLDARVTPELLLQIFYPNTPLHDGAAVIVGTHIVAASCVMPLSASGILARTIERQMGLRHRAALGISEISDAIVIIVSEETGFISISHSGRMIRRLDSERLSGILKAFIHPTTRHKGLRGLLERLALGKTSPDEEMFK